MENLRPELHNMIDNFPEERLQEVYKLLHDDEYSDEFKKMLDEEYEDYLKTGEAIPEEEVNKLVHTLLYKKE